MIRPWYSDTMGCEELSRHSKNAEGTHKLQVTFRGSSESDKRLWSALKARALQDELNYVDVIREALWRYLGL